MVHELIGEGAANDVSTTVGIVARIKPNNAIIVMLFEFLGWINFMLMILASHTDKNKKARNQQRIELKWG